jgi:hypothetical protein
MTELTVASAEQPEPIPVVLSPAPTVPDTTVLITEQQVLFGTAAAVAPRRRRRLGALGQAIGAIFERPAGAHRPPRPHYPVRHTFLEHSAMTREMRRL